MMLHFLGERFEESTFSAFIAISPPDLGPDLEFKPGPSEGVFGFLVAQALRKNAQKMPLTRVSGIF